MLISSERISYSATATTIRVSPSILFAEQGEHFEINLTIMSAVDVYAWQVNMTFDPSVVSIVNAFLPADNFLEGRPMGTIGLQMFKRSRSVLLGCNIKGDYEGMSGSGTLVTVELEVLQKGESVLKIIDIVGETYLLDHNLVVTDPGSALMTEDGYISNIDHPPTASFTFSPAKPNVNEDITFNASASYDSDGYIVQYEWNFGDGTKTNVTNPTTTHAYSTAQTYTVKLTVIDNATATQLMKDTFNITGMLHTWYELYSSYSASVKLLVDHDIVVTSVSASPTSVTVGEKVTIGVTVENQGKNTETFDVTAYYDGNTAGTKTVENLVANDSETLTLTWDTTGVTPKNYVIKAEASLEGDANPGDNIFQDGSVTVKASVTSFPVEYIAGGVVIAVVIIGIIIFLWRRRTPKTPTT